MLYHRGYDSRAPVTARAEQMVLRSAGAGDRAFRCVHDACDPDDQGDRGAGEGDGGWEGGGGAGAAGEADEFADVEDVGC